MTISLLALECRFAPSVTPPSNPEASTSPRFAGVDEAKGRRITSDPPHQAPTSVTTGKNMTVYMQSYDDQNSRDL